MERRNFIESFVLGTLACRVTRAEDKSDATDVLRPIKPSKTFNAKKNIDCIDVSPDGKLLAAGCSGNKTIMVWELDSGKLLVELSAERTNKYSRVRCVAFSADGKSIFGTNADRTLSVWDLTTKTEKLIAPGFRAALWGLAVSPDGEHVAIGLDDKTVHLHSQQGRQPRVSFDADVTNKNIQFSHDGKLLIVTEKNGGILLTDVQSGALMHVLKGHTGEVRVLDRLAKTGLVSGGLDRSVRIWDLTTLKQTAVLKLNENIHSIGGSHDGNRFAVGLGDNGLRVFETASLKAVNSLEGFDYSVLNQQFFECRGITLVASSGASAYLWKLKAH